MPSGLKSFPTFSFSFSIYSFLPFFFDFAVFPLHVLWFLVETGAKEIRDDCDEDRWRMKSHFLTTCTSVFVRGWDVGGGVSTTGAGVCRMNLHLCTKATELFKLRK